MHMVKLLVYLSYFCHTSSERKYFCLWRNSDFRQIQCL